MSAAVPSGCALLSQDLGAWLIHLRCPGRSGVKKPRGLLPVQHLASVLVLGQAFCAGSEFSHCVKLPDSECFSRANVTGFCLSKINTMLFLL